MSSGASAMWKENSTEKPVRTKLDKDQRGTSMVTVLVSFALLLLCLTSFYRVQKMTESMVMNSKDMIRNNSSLMKAFYLGETTSTTIASGEVLIFEGEDGGFSMTVTLHRAQKEGLNGSIYYFEEE